jgi:hypothetical protein
MFANVPSEREKQQEGSQCATPDSNGSFVTMRVNGLSAIIHESVVAL